MKNFEFKIFYKNGKPNGYSASGNYSGIGDLETIYHLFQQQVETRLVEKGMKTLPKPLDDEEIGYSYYANYNLRRRIFALIEALPENKIFYSPGCDKRGNRLIYNISKAEAKKINVIDYRHNLEGLLLMDYSGDIPF